MTGPSRHVFSSSSSLHHPPPLFSSLRSPSPTVLLFTARGFCLAASLLTVLSLVLFIVNGMGGYIPAPSSISSGTTLSSHLTPALPCPDAPSCPPPPPPSPTSPSGPCLPCECPCTSGPYVLQSGCETFNEGIGSKFQRIKTSLTVAHMANFTFLSERGCFTESHNGWDFADRFWVHRSTDCDACSVRTRAKHSINLAGSPTQTWPEPTFHQAVCPPITGELRQRLMAGDQTALPHNTAGREALYQMFGVLQSTPPALQSSLVFSFPHRERSIEFLNSCSAPLVRERYAASYERQVAAGVRTVLPMAAERFHIAVHFRWGDTKRPDVEKPDNRASFPISTFSAVVQAMLGLEALQGRTEVWFCSEGERQEFARFSPGVDVHWRLGEDSQSERSDTLDDLDVLAHADVLIGGESSFFALASQFNDNNTRVLVGRTLDSNGARNPKYQDHGTGFYADMLTLRPFDLPAFEKQLKALPQYERKASGGKKG